MASLTQSNSGILSSGTLTWTQRFCKLEMLRGKLYAQSIPVVTHMSTKVSYTVYLSGCLHLKCMLYIGL